MTPRRILIAPTAFKTAAGSNTIAHALARGIARAWPHATLTRLPLADGGDGTLTALAAAEPGVEITRTVHGPHGEALQAAWWQSETGPAVIEMARASGLAVTRHRRPLTATTYGTGQLITAALTAARNPARAAGHNGTATPNRTIDTPAHTPTDTPAPEIWITCGGSATIDAGAGALQALGFQLLDAHGRPLPPGGAALIHLATIIPPPTTTHLPPPRLTVLSDVDNPLLGPDGAAATYAPQKGAHPTDIPHLEAALTRFADICAATFGRDPRNIPGTGAAGGLPAALYAALGAQLRPGFDTLAPRLGLDAALTTTDLIITAEGRIDHQTPRGKTIAGLVTRAATHNLPIWIFAGEVTPEAETWCPPHAALIPIADGPRTHDASITATRPLLERAAYRTARLAARWM